MPVAIIVPIDAVDEIRVFKDTVVVESFGVDAQSFLLLEYLGQGLSQIGHLKPLSVGVTPSNTSTSVNNVIGTFASIFLVVPKERSTSSIAMMDFVATLYIVIHGR